MSNLNRVTPQNIQILPSPTYVFVFGSNEAGRHGRGAAKTAVKFGAQYGVGIGLQKQTYAIPTKDKDLKSLAIVDIELYVQSFIRFAYRNPSLTFMVTEIGCGLAGFTPYAIAPMFQNAIQVSNIYLPARFWAVLNSLDDDGDLITKYNNLPKL